MNPIAQKIIVVAASLALGGASTFAVTWFASAGESHEDTDVNTEEISEMAELVKSNAAILDKLAERQLEKDAAREATINLCKAGDISKCSVCRGVGIYDAPACDQ